MHAEAKAPAKSGKALLNVNARNDVPGSVQVKVEGWNVKGDQTINTVLDWDADDNSFSSESVEISKKTRMLRFTFINDDFTPGDPDLDRNAFIDYFLVNNVSYEAQSWDRTGGTDPNFPGCEQKTIDGRSVADCGNQGDWVEYDLHPGNPVGPDPNGPGRRIGPKGKMEPPPVNTETIVQESDNAHLTAMIRFPEPIMTNVEVGSETYTQMHVPGLESGPAAEVSSAVGKPAVKIYHRLIAVPIGAQAVVYIKNFSSYRVHGINLYPFQASAVDLTDANGEPPPERFMDPPFTKDDDAYAQDALFPSEIVSLQVVGQMRDINVVQLNIASAQYNAAKQTLFVTEDAEVEVAYEGGTGNFLTGRSANPFESYNNRAIAEHSFLNGNLIYRHIEPLPILPFKCIGEELIIITHEDFIDAANDLRDWKREKGISTNVYETNDSTTKEKIRDFIKDHYEDCLVRPSYVLLLGDAEFIPPWYRWTDQDATTGTDLDYSLMTAGDILADLGVARIPVDTDTQAQTVVDKIINYEKNPPYKSSFYKNAAFPAYFQCCRTDVFETTPPFDMIEGITSRGYIETMEQIRDELVSDGYGVNRLYASDTTYHPGYTGNTTPRMYFDQTNLPAAIGPGSGFAWNAGTNDIINAIDNGRFLVIHRNHGTEDEWIRPIFQTTDVATLKNKNLLPVLFSVDCSTGLFDNETDSTPKYHGVTTSGVYLLEAMLRKSNGGVPGVEPLFPAVVPHGGTKSIRRLADILNHGKLYMYTQIGAGINPADPIDQNEADKDNILWHAFGDPTQEIWTSYPYFLAKVFEYEIFPRHIQVKYAEEGAVITAMQGSVPIGRATVKNQWASLEYVKEPDPNKSISFFASKQNFISTRLGDCYPDLPKPNLTFTGSEDYIGSDGKEYTRYNLVVTNSEDFPDELFEAAPDLPPCGLNTNSSRTWVNIYDNSDSRLYGFCALSSSDGLESLSFSKLKGIEPPQSVYIKIRDRRCDITYKSDLVNILSIIE
jgi:hypothetical protein